MIPILYLDGLMMSSRLRMTRCFLKRMIDDIKKYFQCIQFDYVSRLLNIAVDAMATIGSLLDVPHDVSKYEFLVDQLHTLTYEGLEIEMVCKIVVP